MSSHHPDAAAAELPEHDSPKKSAGRRNRRALWPVVQVVGRSRGVAAAVVTVGMIAAGCGSADGGEDTPTTTSAAAAEESGNPWDLPVEQRPALFDPCADVPTDAVERAVGAPVRREARLTKSDPGNLHTCGWITDELIVDLVATWKSHADYLLDPTGVIADETYPVSDRIALRLLDRADDPNTCRYLFFTGQGTVAISTSLTTTFKTFRGERFADVCDVLHEVSSPLVQFVPPGDYR